MKKLKHNSAGELSQSKMLEIFWDLLQEEGSYYNKLGGVWAREAIPGEKVETIISGVKETENVAISGDFVILNDPVLHEDLYILHADNFSKEI